MSWQHWKLELPSIVIALCDITLYHIIMLVEYIKILNNEISMGKQMIFIGPMFVSSILMLILISLNIVTSLLFILGTFMVSNHYFGTYTFKIF